MIATILLALLTNMFPTGASSIRRRRQTFSPVAVPGGQAASPAISQQRYSQILPSHPFISSGAVGTQINTGQRGKVKGGIGFPIGIDNKTGQAITTSVGGNLEAGPEDIGFLYGHLFSPTNNLKLPIEKVYPCLFPNLCPQPKPQNRATETQDAEQRSPQQPIQAGTYPLPPIPGYFVPIDPRYAPQLGYYIPTGPVAQHQGHHSNSSGSSLKKDPRNPGIQLRRLDFNDATTLEVTTDLPPTDLSGADTTHSAISTTGARTGSRTTTATTIAPTFALRTGNAATINKRRLRSKMHLG